MDLLPDEILDMIFQYISTGELFGVCQRVCRRWKRIAERRALEFRFEGDESRLHRGTRAVVLTKFPVNIFSTLTSIATATKFLRELTAHAPAPFHDEHLTALKFLPHLKHLDIFTKSRLLTERFVAVGRRLTTLVVNEYIAPGVLRDMSTGLQLVALHMYGRSLYFPPREMMAVLRVRAPYMQELTLRAHELSAGAYDVIGNCFNLRVLHLYSCWSLTQAGARAVCRPKHLRQLHLTGARLLRRQALAHMLAMLPTGLQELALSNGWFSDEHVEILLRRVPDLRIFELWDGKMTLTGALDLAAGLPKLEQLDLDLTLSTHHLQMLARHPSLRFVRCMPECEGCNPNEYIEEHPQWEVDGLQIVATYARFPRKYFRGYSDGHRSALYYYWTHDIFLEPLAPHASPNLDPCEEQFY